MIPACVYGVRPCDTLAMFVFPRHLIPPSPFHYQQQCHPPDQGHNQAENHSGLKTFLSQCTSPVLKICARLPYLDLLQPYQLLSHGSGE